MNQLVDFAVGRGGSIDRAGVVVDHQRLHLKLLRREDDARLAVGCELVDARRRTGRGIDIACWIGGDIPDVSGRRGVERTESGREGEVAIAADGDAVSRTLLEVVVLGLFPGAGGLRPARRKKERGQERQSKHFHHEP